MPGGIAPKLVEALQSLASELPTELVLRVAQIVSDSQTTDGWQLDAQVFAALPQPAARERVRAMLGLWHTLAPELPAVAMAFALETAALTADQFRRQQFLELVWTGPDSEVIPLRRTDQALLELIDSARLRLIIVSFAVYKAEAIARALVRAAQRGVAIKICLETPDASEGKVTFDMFAALGPDIRRGASSYVWPLAARPRSPDGHHGSLHAKVAVADGHTLFISSANLTEYAMSLNMEMGILVHGGELPIRVEQHFTRLIDNGILEMVAAQ